MATRLSAGVGYEAAPLNIAAGAEESRGQATNLSGSHRPSTTNNILSQVEYFADEMVLGELEKREIMGMPINRRMSVAMVLCCCVSVVALIVIMIKAFSGGHHEESLPQTANISPQEGQKRYEEIQASLEPLTGVSITQKGTPEEAALYWMAYEDPMQLSPRAHIDKLTQRFVLATLYFATNGEDWEHHYSFLSDYDECEWHHDGDAPIGVYCDTKGYVDGIILHALNLNGTLPRDIGLLTHLSHIDLAGNQIRGNLPSSLGILGELTHLDVSKCFGRLNYMVHCECHPDFLNNLLQATITSQVLPPIMLQSGRI